MSKKQKTLFEAWNQNSSKGTFASSTSNRNETVFPSTSGYNSPGQNVFQPTFSSRTSKVQVDGNGFDSEAGKTWIYPTNYPVRDYQFSIVQEALFKNTLVILPTGLGKTFIAAVVMYNIYRWYPKGKVVFMAPTRPLVAQQIEACYKVTGIPPIDTTQMTGTNNPEERKRMWIKKRVFFLTPQVLVNDLVRNICPAFNIKCIVVDEAHKALGNHAFCQVIHELQAYTTNFRVLALTATPGSDMQAVKLVLTNLLISHVELRSEDSDDVKQYTHIRDIEKIVVPLGDRLMSIKSRFLDVINVYLKRLTQRRAMSAKNPASLSKYQILKMRDDFSQHPPDAMDKYSYGLAMADFSLCISLYHSYELLLLHGARQFYNFLLGIINGEKSIPHARSELLKNLEFEELFREVQENYIAECPELGPNNAMSVNGNRVLPGHPKLEKLLEVVLKHFNDVNRESITDTRVMIFSQYRDSVQEIVEMLHQHQPMIKVMSFIGQASKAAGNVGYSQKHQLKVIQEFRSGGYNTLVSTCVGEEGLDIGEVDLIVCYDCPKSPIRLVQRMGRTGRLRRGRIIILIAEGKEEQMFNSCESKKKSIHRAISKGFAFAQLYSNSPSLIPTGVMPVCEKMTITVETIKDVLKPKGKCKESAFLTEEELVEYNNCFKVEKTNQPLFPKSNMISLKQVSEGNTNSVLSSVEPKLCLSKWLLWQTTPQRTHMVSHSSKSLLFIETVEKVNFPHTKRSSTEFFKQNTESITSPKKTIPKLLNNTVKTSNNSKEPLVIDLCEDSFPEFEELPCVSNNLPTKDYHQGKLDHYFSIVPNQKVCNTTNLLSPSFPNIHKTDSLLNRLFGIDSLKIPHSPNFDIPKPSYQINDISVGDFPGVYFESSLPDETKSGTMLFILNKKMKAKIKRKMIEMGMNTSFVGGNSQAVCNDSLNLTLRNATESIQKILPKKINDAYDSMEKATNINSVQNIMDETLLQKTITFDIDFDSPEIIEDNEDKNNFEQIDLMTKKNCDFTKSLEGSDHNDSTHKYQKHNLSLNQNFDCLEGLESNTIHKKPKKFILKTNQNSDVSGVLDNKNNGSTANCEELDMGTGEHFDNPEMLLDVKASDKLTIPNRKRQNGSFNDVSNLDSSLIFEQFFSTKDDDIMENLDSSFSIPLTIKKVVYESSTTSSQDAQKANNVLKDNNSVISNTFKTNPMHGKTRCQNLASVPFQANGQSFAESNSSKKLESSKEMGKEATQYSLTQLVTLINDTQPNKATRPEKCTTLTPVKNQDTRQSSEEEVAPTPPRKITSKKFCYRSRSLNLDLNSLSNSHFQQNDQTIPGPTSLKTSISFNLSSGGILSSQKAEASCSHKEMKKPIIDSKLTKRDVTDSVSKRDKTDSRNGQLNEINQLTREVKFQNKYNSSKSNFSFDLSDVTCENNGKLPALPVNCSGVSSGHIDGSRQSEDLSSPDEFNRNISFDLSDIQFLSSDEIEHNFNNVGKQQNLSNTIGQSTVDGKKMKSVSDKLSSSICSDLSDVQFSPCVKENKAITTFKTVETTPKVMDNVLERKFDTSFESHTLDKIFFNISFDSPEEENVPLELSKELTKTPKSFPQAKKASLTPQKQSPSGVDKNTKPMFPPNPRDSNVSKIYMSSLPYGIRDIQPNHCLSQKQVCKSNILPQCGTSNQRQTINNKNDILSMLSITESSEGLFEQDKKKNKVLQKPLFKENKADSFKKPVNKIAKPVNERKRNKFLCTQAAVSGSESSSDDIGGEEDAMEESFINDDTLVESPLNQRAMYLESVKNIVGLPQRFKLKERGHFNDQIFSQMPEADCTTYMLDSFCVEDDEVSFSDSEDEVENKPRNLNSKQKRKRIVNLNNTSSSEEEVLVKSLKTPEGRLLRKIRPELDSPTFGGCIKNSRKRKLMVGRIVSDDSEDFSPVRKNTGNILRNCLADGTGRNNQQNQSSVTTASPITKGTFQYSEARKVNVPNENNIDTVSSKTSLTNDKEPGTTDRTFSQNHGQDLEDLHNICLDEANISFDIDWDDPDTLPDELLGIDDSRKNLASISVVGSAHKANDVTFRPQLHSTSVEDGLLPPKPSTKHLQANDTNNNSASFCSTTLPSTNNIPTAKIILVDSHKLVSDKPIISCLQNSSTTFNNSTTFCSTILPSTSNHSTAKTILVDSRELASGKPVISCLRNKYGINPVVMQLASSDYIISNRVAIERIMDSDFPNSGPPSKQIEKVRSMIELYESSFVIIETDSSKKMLGFNKSSTKFLQFALDANLHPALRVLYSSSMEETSNVIFDLIEKERKKSLQISVPITLSSSSQKVFEFYTSIPGVNTICAFNFVYNFPCVGLLFKSTVKEIKSAGFISTRKATDIWQYIQSQLSIDSFS